jgi:magnesium chelatase subunit D
VDGLRADLVTARAAIAHAAWAGRPEVTAEDIRAAVRLAIPHRRRRQPFDAPGLPDDELDRALAEATGDDGPDDDDDPGPRRGGGRNDHAQPDGRADRDGGVQPGGRDGSDGQDGPGDHPDRGRRGSDRARASEHGTRDGTRELPAAAPGTVFRVKRLDLPGAGSGAPGRRSRSRSGAGRVTGAQLPRGRLSRLHLAATIAAAAPHQRARGRTAVSAPLQVRRDDLREAQLEGRESNLVLFLVDASGSMAARSRMGAVKGAILSLLIDAYQRRDKVGMVTFRGSEAQLLLPPTSSVEAAAARLAALPTGGRTPLAAGLVRAHEVLRAERLRDPRRRPLLVLVTDGRATGGPAPVASAHRAAALLAAAGVASVVVDCETGPVRIGLAAALAATLRGAVLEPAELAAGPLADSVRLIGGLQGAAPLGQCRGKAA